jgi:hypothetical protein
MVTNNPNLQNFSFDTTDDVDHKVNQINTALRHAFEEASPITYISTSLALFANHPGSPQTSRKFREGYKTQAKDSANQQISCSLDRFQGEQ